MRLPPVSPHWAVRAPNGEYVFDPLTGRTIASPWPWAWHTCMKQEAEELCERLNAAQPETAAPFQIEALNLTALIAQEHEFDGVHLPNAEAA